MQELLDRSAKQAQSPMLRRIFKIPANSLNARQLIRLFDGIRQAALATANVRGEPRVVPIDVILLHGNFHTSTDQSTTRANNLTRRKEISLTYFEGQHLAVIINGTAAVFRPGDGEFDAIDSEVRKHVGMGAEEASKLFGGTGALWIRVEPR